MKALIPGSFDPITLGHTDIILRSLKLFDEIIVCIENNISKTPMFTIPERKEMILLSITDLCEKYNISKSYIEDKVLITSYDGTTADFCKKNNVSVIVRGVRTGIDFENEMSYFKCNNELEDIETVLLPSQYNFISSSLVREMITFKSILKNVVSDSIKRVIVRSNYYGRAKQ